MNQRAKLGLAVVSGLLGGVLAHYLPQPVVHAQSRTTGETRLYLTNTFTSHGHGVMLAADSIVRDASVIHLKGNVEIKLRPSSPNQDVMILHADEADYNRKTDEIIPLGNVRVTLETPR
jgi:lipopolysaccharide assembly outer membrane protein LptD (OstA)